MFLRLIQFWSVSLWASEKIEQLGEQIFILGTDLKVVAQCQVYQDGSEGGSMRLEVLIGELLEVIQDLLLDNWCQTLDLFNEDAFVQF